MNKEISKILRDRLRANGGLPFIEKYAGMVQTVTQEQSNEDGTVKKKFPVSTEVVLNDVCLSNEEVMTPDSSLKGIVYFEDNGTTTQGKVGNRFNYTSNLMLVCWINRAKVTSNIYSEITAIAINDIMNKLDIDGNPKNVSLFTGLTASVTRIAPQEASIFARYSYEESISQYLRPPFEFFGLGIQVKFSMNPKCVQPLEITSSEICY